jgi:hypothetical protein
MLSKSLTLYNVSDDGPPCVLPRYPRNLSGYCLLEALTYASRLFSVRPTTMTKMREYELMDKMTSQALVPSCGQWRLRWQMNQFSKTWYP